MTVSRTQVGRRIGNGSVALLLLMQAAIVECLPGQEPAGLLADVQDSTWSARVELSVQQLQRRTRRLRTEGMTPILLDAYEVGPVTHYIDIWRKRPGDREVWDARVDLTPEELQARTDELTQRGYYPLSLNAYTFQGRVWFCDVWLRSDSMREKWDARVDLSQSELEQRTERLRQRGFRPLSLVGYSLRGRTRYCDIWVLDREGSTWDARVQLTRPALDRHTDDMRRQGYRPVHLSAWSQQNRTVFAGIWMKSDVAPEAWDARVDLTRSELQQRTYRLRELGYEPQLIEGYPTRAGLRFCDLWTLSRPRSSGRLDH